MNVISSVVDALDKDPELIAIKKIIAEGEQFLLYFLTSVRFNFFKSRKNSCETTDIEKSLRRVACGSRGSFIRHVSPQ